MHPPPPPAWARCWASPVCERALAEVDTFVRARRRAGAVFPAPEHVWAALERTPPARVRVVIVGQDPYHGPGQAHGLAFSVPRGVPAPPSLRNMLTELTADRGVPMPAHGDLRPWADRGVLLLNTILTVDEGQPLSHAGHGWEVLTNAVLEHLAADSLPRVFALWGARAQRFGAKLQGTPHARIDRAHPSPLSAHRGFLGTRPFGAIDDALVELGHAPLDWRLP